MALIKCKMCGGDLKLVEGSTVCECEYCGTKQTVPSADSEKKLTLFARAGRLLRACEFDKAAGVFESIVADFPDEAEAYWGLVLCKYGIEYVDDPATGKKIPTCHRSSFDNVMKDPNFEQACENTDAVARRVYRDEARAIEELRKSIIEVSGKEEPYDVFISYKETDANGGRTPDSVIAQEIYRELTREGCRVFFSRISLENRLGTEYEPYIFAALNSAKVMIVVGTDYENFDSVWVKNEWSRYLKLIAKGEKKTLIPVFRDMDAYDMPEEFNKLTALDMGKIGAVQDLVHGVGKLVGKKKAEAAQAQPVQQVVQQTVVQGGGPNVLALLKRGHQALEDGDWDKARGFYDQVLSMDAENTEAFLGLALAGSRSRDTQSYINNLCSGSAKVETLTLDRDKAHIEESIAKAAVPGYCDEKELRKLYNFDVSYSAKLRGETTFAQQVKAQFSSDRNLARAFRYAQGETKQKLEALKKNLYDRLDKRVKAAEAADKEALAAAKADYAAKLSAADRKAEERSNPAKEKREADYREAIDKQAKAQTRLEFWNAQTLFKALKGYKDTDARAEECGRRANELWAAEKAEEEKAKAAQKKKKRTIGIVVGVLAVAAIAFVVVWNNIIIPKQKLNTAMGLLDSGDYEAAYALFEEIGNSDAIAASKYDRAVALIDAGHYEEALILLDGLNYNDSTDRVLEIKKTLFPALYNASVGKLITFGSYEQDNNTSNGKEDIEWLVLAKEGDRILVISRYALDCKQYNTENSSVTWGSCTLRKWLNDSFLNEAFSKEEQALIPMVAVSADKNPDYTTNPGNSTLDQVFLLSAPEAQRYFSSDEARKCVPTAYAIAQGAYTSNSYSAVSASTCFWWLRSPGNNSQKASGVLIDGSIRSIGHDVDCELDTVRPALWVALP